jgi:hypothetical protein
LTASCGGDALAGVGAFAGFWTRGFS